MPKPPPVGSCSFFIPLQFGCLLTGIGETLCGCFAAFFGFVCVLPLNEESDLVKRCRTIAYNFTIFLGNAGPSVLLILGLFLIGIGILLVIAVHKRHLKLLEISWMLRAGLTIVLLINFIAHIVFYFIDHPGANIVLYLCIAILAAYYGYVVYSLHYKLSERMVTASQPDA